MYNINTYLYLRDKLKNQLVLSQFKPQIFSSQKDENSKPDTLL